MFDLSVTTRHEKVDKHDFDSPLKINETFGSQNHYETYSFKNHTIQAPMK